MQKLLSIFLLLFLSLQASSQETSKFEFWISSLDKAGYDRVTYHVTENEITVKDGPYDFIYFAKNYKSDRVVFKTKLNSLQKDTLCKIGLVIYNDSLKSQYDNLCIIGGMILSFDFEWGKKQKNTTISNYYLSSMAPFVDFVNKNVPEKYKIYFDKEELQKEMKDCPPDKILH